MDHTDVFINGADGVNTYRIPALIVAPGGTLLAFCEARKLNGGDASPTDMVLKRSADNGNTWGPMQRLIRGEGAEAFMNPCPVVDGKTVLLFCMKAHTSGQWRHRQLVLRSDDDGLTWSKPEDVTEALGEDRFVPGPGVGIRMRNGRLVVPGYIVTWHEEGKRNASISCVVYSDDRGRSWKRGALVNYTGASESQVIERTDGTLWLNWRIQWPVHPGCRGTAISRDGGETWEEPVCIPALNEAPCQAGLIRLAPVTDGQDRRVLFSNPDAHPGRPAGLAADVPYHGRTKMTVRLSYDDGLTWPAARLIHTLNSSYSSPAVLPDGRIGLLYEHGETLEPWRFERLRLVRFDTDWLEEGRGGS